MHTHTLQWVQSLYFFFAFLTDVMPHSRAKLYCQKACSLMFTTITLPLALVTSLCLYNKHHWSPILILRVTIISRVFNFGVWCLIYCLVFLPLSLSVLPSGGFMPLTESMSTLPIRTNTFPPSSTTSGTLPLLSESCWSLWSCFIASPPIKLLYGSSSVSLQHTTAG